MDEEITIIDSSTRNEKFKNFFINNKTRIIVGLSILLIMIVGYLLLLEIKNKNKIKLANQFNLVTINFKIENKKKTIDQLTNLLNKNDSTYSPLALYFLIDNNLIEDKGEINILFNKIINETRLDKEIKNLIIYKKALFNSDFATENDLLKILSPIISSESIWKAHSLYLLGEYFYSKNEKKKAKEFFEKILEIKNVNSEIQTKSQKRINRDISE